MSFLKRHIRELFAVVIIAGIAASFFITRDTVPVPDISDVVWNTYRNSAFGFSIEYPSTWRVAEFPDNEVVPMFNFYKPESIGQEQPPLLNLSTVTHVSVYPRGVPADNDQGLTKSSLGTAGVPISKMIDHVLLNGEVWATQATPTAIPPMWNTRGFIWAGLAVSGFALQCMKEEEITSMDACRKGGDGTIAYDGSVDKRDQLIEEHMLTSIRFIR